ncbi:MAG TPA: molybdenum cofactor synthesis domain-containing protein [Bacteroidales bacterium]|nr:molybdenum cofactor synthesis domain-containing protein [Bacteroidales bacterium]
MKLPEIFEVLIVTLSDRASGGEYDDRSGPELKERVSDFFKTTGWRYKISTLLIADDPVALKRIVAEGSEKYNIIITTGGTGIGPKDITAGIVRPLLEKEIPGIMEFIRVKYGSVNPNALLSNGVAGVAGKSLIYTLPGSVRAVGEYMSEINKTLRHTILMQHGVNDHTDH